jgi:hypothetical protein
MKTNQNIILRKIHDTFFLIDITQNYFNDKCTLYEINESVAFIWERLKSGQELNDIYSDFLNMLVSNEPVDEILSDLEEYVAILKANGFLED